MLLYRVIPQVIPISEGSLLALEEATIGVPKKKAMTARRCRCYPRCTTMRSSEMLPHGKGFELVYTW